MRARLLLPLLLLALALLLAPAASAAPGEIASFELPWGSEPEGIATGPDGNLWFAERGSNSIGRLTPAGELAEFPLPTAHAEPFQVTAGPDGDVWFTESGSGDVGRITPGGAISEFPICGYCRPWGITTGPEGNLWVALAGAGEVARVTPTGTVTRFPLNVGAEPRQIVLGPDGNLWMAAAGLVREEPTIGLILRLTPGGEVTKFLVPTPTENFRPLGIANGPGDALWFAGSGTGVGRIDTGGAFAEFPLPTLFGEIDTIVTGPDGNLWFADSGPGAAAGSVDRMTVAGRLTTYQVPYGSKGLTVGPEGSIWFTEWAEHRIGRIVPGASGIELRTSRVVVHKRPARSAPRVHLTLYCNGGTPAPQGFCTGTVLLRGMVRHRSGAKGRWAVLGSVHYSVADRNGQTLTLRLDRRRLRLLPRAPGIRIEALARATAGVGARRTVELVRPIRAGSR
jgi:streptogramin lyase